MSFHCNVIFLLIHSISADAWPQIFDDSEARADWGWRPEYDLDKLVHEMIKTVKENYIDKNGK